ncbi:unnamed protein product [Thlaspi arvense]|uniref:C-JID domain-containing protein n=1 Tax=Thlaspi arvense TaxID=13288 RepID=A0AAU9T873_THLAR|nr:unnamed protein product [Thlaspi arvense]
MSCCLIPDYGPCPLSLQRIKRCGVRVMNVSPSACGATPSSESAYNQRYGENCDLETRRNKKRMHMEAGASEESSNILCDQIVENTGVTVPNLEPWLPPSSVSSSKAKEHLSLSAFNTTRFITFVLGTENVLGMYFNTSEIDEPLFINEKSFKGMRNLTFLKFYKEWSEETGEGRLYLPQGFIYLPRKLRLLYWDEYPLTSIRFNFRAEILVKLTMENSKLEKLWEGDQFDFLNFDKAEEHLVELTVPGSKLEKLWEGVQQVDFSDCEGVTAFSDESAVTHSADDRLPVTVEASSFHLVYLIVCAKNCKSLQSISLQCLSHSFLNPMSSLKFHNCFNLDRDARKLILQSDFESVVLPGGEVPTYFRHRACGTSLTIPLPKSSVSRKVLRVKACVMLEPPTGYNRDRSARIRVHWYFRGKSNIHNVYVDVDSCDVDHLVVFQFEFSLSKEVDRHPCELDYNNVEFKFVYHGSTCACHTFFPHDYKQTCPYSFQRIKGCGVQLLNVSPSEEGSGTSSQTEYNQKSGESDIDSGRSKKRMWMTVITPEEASSTRLMANLELSLGQGGASAQMSCRSLIPSSSVSSSNFHGDGASSHLSLSPSEPCLGEEALYFDPMITEQQDTETPIVDGSLSPQLIHFLRINLGSTMTIMTENIPRDRARLRLNSGAGESFLQRILRTDIAQLRGSEELWEVARLHNCESSFAEGTETVLGINFNTSDIKGPLFLDEKSFEGMPNLQFLRVCVDHWFPEAEDRLNLQGHWFTDHWLPQGLLYLPPGLRLLSWEKYPSKCLPFTFKAEFLVEIDMMHSKLEKLWDGTQIWPKRSHRVKSDKQDAQEAMGRPPDCGEVTAMSDAIVVATVSMEDQFPPRSSYGGSIRESIYCNFNNCFKLDEHARELILRSYYSATVLPGGEVPTYFTHQASGYSLTVTVPQSSLSQEFLRFKTCLVVDHGTDLFLEVFPYVLGVRWYFRGRSGMHNVSLYPRKMDHLVMFHFGLTLGELSGPPSDVGYNHVKFEFFHHTYDCCHFAEPCPLSLQRVKRCGVRVLNVSPSACGATTSSESEYNQQSEENCDVETGRSKKRMRMAVRESEESSNTLCGRIVENTGGIVPNLELSLGQGEASTQVSSRRNKIPSSSVSSSNNFHCEGASLCLSLSPSYPCLKGEASCVVDPMITEQQDTETTIVVHSLSPQFINNLSLSPSEPCLGGEAIFFDPMITEQQDTETSSIVDDDGELSESEESVLRLNSECS